MSFNLLDVVKTAEAVADVVEAISDVVAKLQEEKPEDKKE